MQLSRQFTRTMPALMQLQRALLRLKGNSHTWPPWHGTHTAGTQLDVCVRAAGRRGSLVTYHDNHNGIALYGWGWGVFVIWSAASPPPPSCRSSICKQMNGRAERCGLHNEQWVIPFMTTLPPLPLPVLPFRPSPAGLNPIPPQPRWSRHGTARNAGHQRENLVISGDPSPSYPAQILVRPPPPPPTSVDRLS